ncbi:hypothetical protein ABI59_14445 [Acidobacteria bacterium Mor1]|nr:hypothetical protein ABI59_14445 [Acidobacteria bacterium Mor1]
MSALPDHIVKALLDVEQATRSLADATQQTEPEGIHTAIDHRGEAIERLRTAIEAAREGLDESARAELKTWSEDIGTQAEQVESALGQVLESTRGALEELAKGMRAARAYQDAPKDPTLNRST